jgi:hypothetical protein
MSNMTPFEIRLDLLKMAKDMLTDSYFSEKDRLSADWNVKVDSAKLNGLPIPEHPTYPPYPSETDVINKAQLLNGFVSNIQTETKTSSTKLSLSKKEN